MELWSKISFRVSEFPIVAEEDTEKMAKAVHKKFDNQSVTLSIIRPDDF